MMCPQYASVIQGMQDQIVARERFVRTCRAKTKEFVTRKELRVLGWYYIKYEYLRLLIKHNETCKIL